MTKKFWIWGLVQDRLSPGFALHVHPMFRGGGEILVKMLIQIRLLSVNSRRSENSCEADAQLDVHCMNVISTMPSCPVSVPCPHAA